MMCEELSIAILSDLLRDFLDQKLGTEALRTGYTGLSILALQRRYCNGPTTTVDFDLTLKDLENDKSIKTGPLAPYENRPDSLFILAMFYSKREYAFLTEKGYKMAQKNQSPRKTQSSTPNVHISGGTFHHSPIGVGTNVTQSINVDMSNQSESVTQLLQLLSHNGAPVDEGIERQVSRMVDVTNQGNLTEAKPIFQKLFGATTESVKNIAWGVLTAIITKQMGLS